MRSSSRGGVKVDYVMADKKGRLIGSGGAADMFLDPDWQPGLSRPWKEHPRGPSYVSVINSRGKLVTRRVDVHNAPATLLKQEWEQVDGDVIQPTIKRMKLWNDMRAKVPNVLSDGLGTIILQYQTATRIGPATISMDGLRQGERDRPVYDLRGLPIPLIHKDVSFSMREIRVARRGSQKLDTTVLRQSAEEVAIAAEKLSLGVSGSYSYGGSTVYGVTNFPDRYTMTLTAPTDPGWTPEVLNEEIADALQILYDAQFYGPFNLYFSPAWIKYMNLDYSSAYPGVTTRSRISQNDPIVRIDTLDHLTGYQFVMIEYDRNTIEAVEGMPITTLQEESQKGFEWSAKIWAIMVPRLKSRDDNTTGILHAAA